VQLHPVDVQNRPHETTCRHSEPPLVKRDEAQHIPRRRGRGGSARRAIHSGYGSPERGRSKPSATRASRSSAVTVEKGHGSRGETTVTRSAITKQKRWRRRGQGARFSFSGYSLRLRKPKWEASSRVKNRHWSLSRIYKVPGETRSTLRPNPPRDSKLKGKTLVPRTAHARTTAAPRTTRPVALTLRQDRRHLWQAKQATLHLLHDDRVKKVRHVVQIHIPFSLPLSLSCYRDQERGYSERDPSLRRKWAPALLLIRGSKAGPSEGFNSRLRAIGPRALLLIRGSKAGPSEEFDSRLRALGLRAHHWSEVQRLAPQMGSTTTSSHSGSAPTTDQGFVGWPPKGSIAASEHAERGMTLGTSDTWPRLGLRSRGTLGHFRD
jgi:hypothetical protein